MGRLPKRRDHVLPILALAASGSLWGTGFLFGKIALAEMPVGSMVLFRFAFAFCQLSSGTGHGFSAGIGPGLLWQPYSEFPV